MKKNTYKTELSPIDKADKAKGLVIEKEEAIHSIDSMTSQITMLKSRISEIDSELNSLLGLNNAQYPASSGRLVSSKYAIPKKGLAKDMAGVMSDSEPMTIKEIVEHLKIIENNKGDQGLEVKENSVRSYLTNLDCFKCIKKDDPRYSKKGWICDKKMLE